MILAASVARASGRNTAALSPRPSSGQNTTITKRNAGTMDQCSPVLSS
jgi:hypothetical protein